MKLIIENQHIIAIREDGQMLEFDLSGVGLVTTMGRLKLDISPEGIIELTLSFAPVDETPE